MSYAPKTRPTPWAPPPRVSCFVPTDEDWAPSFALGWSARAETTEVCRALVEVSCIRLGSGRTRVCVWGADNTGVERDFDSETEARAVFWTILEWPAVNHGRLQTLGFKHA